MRRLEEKGEIEMNNKVKEFIFDYLQREYTIESDDIMSLNFVETGYVDSIGLLSFIATIEDEFGIEFSDDELQDPNFRVVGPLIDIVVKKVRGDIS